MNLIEFLQQHNIDYREGGAHKHVRIGWIGVDCPKCGPGSKRFHAGIQEDLSRATCWRCGSFKLWDLLGKLASIPWWEARDCVNLLLVTPDRAVCHPIAVGVVQVPTDLLPLSGPYERYLRMRGFDSNEIISTWGIQATGPVGRLAWRLWIPIRLAGETVSWTTRAIGDDHYRYISASPEQEKINHKTLLYGEDLAGSAVIVVEGPLDAWAIGPGAVAIMGLLTTPEQIERIGRHPLRAICCDNEPAALRRAEQMADMLQQYPGETHIVELETGADPAEANADEIAELRRRFLD